MPTIAKLTETYITGLIDSGVTVTEDHLRKIADRVRDWEMAVSEDMAAVFKAVVKRPTPAAGPSVGLGSVTGGTPAVGPAVGLDSASMPATTQVSYSANDTEDSKPGFSGGQS